MGRIKNICLLTNMPGETQGKQVCEGVFSQCQKYGYNVAVFATLNEFDLFVKEIPEDLYRSVRVSGVPAVCISTPVEGIPLIENSNDEALRRICRHVTEVHQCKKVCMYRNKQMRKNSRDRVQ